MPRPTKYSAERAKAICDGIRAGLTRTAAGGRVDVDVTTIQRWTLRYASFATDLMRAEAEAEANFTAVLGQAARPHDVTEITTTVGPDGETTKTVVRREFDWRAALEWLKRRRNKTWGDRKRIDVSDLSTEQLIALLESEGEGGTGEEGGDSGEPD